MKFGFKKKAKKLQLDVDNVWREEALQNIKDQSYRSFWNAFTNVEVWQGVTTVISIIFGIFGIILTACAYDDTNIPLAVVAAVTGGLWIVPVSMGWFMYRTENKDYFLKRKDVCRGVGNPSQKSQYVADFLRRKVNLCSELIRKGPFSDLLGEITEAKENAEQQCNFWRCAFETSSSGDPSLEDRKRYYAEAQVCLERIMPIYAELKRKRDLVSQCIDKLSGNLRETERAVSEYFMAQSLRQLSESIDVLGKEVSAINCKQFSNFLEGVGTVDSVVRSLMEMSTFELTRGGAVDMGRLEKLGEKVCGDFGRYEKEIQAILVSPS